jgi:hypothetical protein
MKFSALKMTPRLLRLPLAEEYVGGQQTLKAFRRKGWLKPIIEHKGNTSFDVRDLDKAVDRLHVEGEEALFGSVDQVDAVVVRR